MQDQTSENSLVVEQLRSIHTILQELKDDVSQVKGQVTQIHEQVKDLPGGLKWVPGKTA
jgi:hypothetical protein